MKLLKFKGSKINEYIDVDISFNDDLSILIGTNGSGKTTTLDLIQALLVPNLLELLRIPFDSIQLSFENLNNYYSIRAEKIKTDLIIDVYKGKYSYETISEESLIINRKIIDEFEFIRNDRSNKNNSIIIKKYIDHPIISFISELQKPVFIGLERTNNDVREDYKNYLYERNVINRKYNNDYYTVNSFKDNLGVSVLETELLIQNIYKTTKAVQDQFFTKIQKELIISSFDFLEFASIDLPTEVDIKEKYRIIERRNEIEDSLKNIGFLDKDIAKKLNIFFDKIDKIFEPNTEFESKGLTLEWLLNKAQVDRLVKIVNIIDEYNSAIGDIFAPINKFLRIINNFLEDTGKKLIVDEVGRLFINKPYGRSLTVDELSSGERQLIILFANVIFNKIKSKKKNINTEVLIIDEPEISLHIRWQELFIKSLFYASDKTQFIIATHSPDIIGENKFKTIRVKKR